MELRMMLMTLKDIGDYQAFPEQHLNALRHLSRITKPFNGLSYRVCTSSALATVLHVPNPAAGTGTAQSPTFNLLTSDPTAVISATPSFPPTAGSAGRTP